VSTYNFEILENNDFLNENAVKMPIYITQLIYLKAGQEAIFHQFENVAIPLIAKYNGALLLRIRPSLETIIESNTENPYEIHLVEFASEQDFQNFMQDEERKQFLHLKEASIRASILIKGVKL
jgi:uncharacterized protein (DUF1330 family)